MKIEALAHRGYSAKYPENTILAYQAAYDLNFAWIELDVHLSKDGIPVIMHDMTLNRTTDGTGFIKEYTFEELQQFKVGGTEPIPTFREALLFAKGKTKVSIELKQKGNFYTGLEEKVLQIIQETGMMDQVQVNSFDHYAIRNMRQLSSDIELGLIQSGASPAVIPFMQEINATYLSVPIAFITDYYANACLEAGKTIVLWAVDKESQFNKAIKYTNALCTTNELEAFKSWYEAYYQDKP